MAPRESSHSSEAVAPPSDDRLDSWKEIASYLKRDVRTVHRWEAEQGLPVRRHLHKKRGTVYAYKSELEAWWQTRSPRLEEAEQHPDASSVGWLAAPGRLVVLGLILCAVLIGAGYFARHRIWPAQPANIGKVTLLVLPFENAGGDAEQEFFSDGMTEEMITELAKLSPGRLGVIARTSAMQYRGSPKAIGQIAAELGVDYVLEGSVRRDATRVRITTRLVQARDQTQLWANSYQRELRDVMTLQSEVASAVAREIAVQLTPQQKLNLASRHPIDPAAHEAYLKGLYFFDKLTEASLTKSIDLFQQAIEIEPGYAAAYARMARAYGLLGNFTALRPDQAYPQQQAAALKALELDPAMYEAHCALGWTKLFYDRDWDAARREFERAVELNPNSAVAHQAYATYFVTMSRFDEAMAEIAKAQKLDPVSLIIMSDIGWYLVLARRTDEAIAQLRKTLEMDPEFLIGHFVLAQAYEQKGLLDQSVGEYEKFAMSATLTNRLLLLGRAYALTGNTAKARRMAANLKRSPGDRYVSPYHLALLYASLGQIEQALDSLDTAHRDRFWMMAFLAVDPRLDVLRPQPRFSALLDQMRLPHPQRDRGTSQPR